MGLESPRWQVERDPLDDPPCVEVAPEVGDDAGADVDGAPVHLTATERAPVAIGAHGDLRLSQGERVVVERCRVGEGLMSLVIQIGDQPMLALMEIDGARVRHAVCGGGIDSADDATGGLLDDLDGLSSGRADADLVDGATEVGASTNRRVAGEASHGRSVDPGGGQCGAEPPLVVLREPELLRCSPEVWAEDRWIVGVEDCRLDGCVQHVLGVIEQVRVERVVAGHEHHGRIRTTSTCPPRLLPQRRHASRVAPDDDRVDARDVDAQPRAFVVATPRSAPVWSAASIARRSRGR